MTLKIKLIHIILIIQKPYHNQLSSKMDTSKTKKDSH